MIHPQFNDSSPAQTSDGSSVITTKIIEIKPLVYFKPLTAFIGLFMGELLAKTWLFLADSGKIPRNTILRMFINSNGKPSVFRIFKKYSTDQKLAYLSLYVILSRLSAWVILSALS